MEKMKSTGVIFKDFSIAGILKQYEYQQRQELIVVKFRAGRAAPPSLSNIGCKTETRRTRGLDKINEFAYRWDFEQVTDEHYVFTNSKTSEKVLIKCPWGKTGDEIWVRETFCAVEMGIEKSEIAYAHKAERQGINPAFLHWKSPRFMPKQAARFILLNEGVSVERLQDISNESAICEGVIPLEDGLATLQYKDRWIEMHGQKSWDLNVLRLCVCLPIAQGFNLTTNFMGQIAQNTCYAFGLI